MDNATTNPVDAAGAASAAITSTTDPLKLLGQILAMAVRHKASDIHLRTRNHPILRVDGVLRTVREIPPMPADFMERLAKTMMSARLQAEFEKNHQADLSIGFKDIGRVRCNAFYQRGSIGMVLRVINTYIPTLQELGVPEIAGKFAGLERGLVLVTGATGSGKSTTLAALINEINNTQTFTAPTWPSRWHNAWACRRSACNTTTRTSAWCWPITGPSTGCSASTSRRTKPPAGPGRR